MRIIPYSVNCGQINMDTDARLLDEAIETGEKEPIFGLYGWAPACVSLGRNQGDDFLDKAFLKKNNIDIVRRLTGGRALFHNDEITYRFICPVSYLEHGENVTASYKEISTMLVEKFSKLGIELTFGTSKPVRTGFDYCMSISTGADLCYKNKKLIGSAQCRKNGYILQHGSILYDYDKDLLKSIFNETVNEEEITSISRIRNDLTKSEIIDTLERY